LLIRAQLKLLPWWKALTSGRRPPVRDLSSS
jgi:hypothetical protein